MTTISQLFQSPDIISLGLTPQELDLVSRDFFGISMTEKILNPKKQLSRRHILSFRKCAERLAQGEPLAYILGYTYFDGLKIKVAPSVLIPRPDSETLVQVVLRVVDKFDASLLDLCTGSGAIGLALKFHRPKWQILSTDVCAEALKIARQNASLLGLKIEHRQADLFEDLGKFDVIAANPPYVSHDDPNLDQTVKDFEPEIAFLSAKGGLDHIARIIKKASLHLNPNGLLVLEHGHLQGKAVREFGFKYGWQDIQTKQDLFGRDRVTLMRVRNDR